MSQEQNDKKKPKEKDISIRKYSEDLLYTSETLLEKNLESITKIFIPIFFVMMFIPGLSVIASALFLANYFVYLMTSEEWKDEFKNASKAKVSVDECKFEDAKENILKQNKELEQRNEEKAKKILSSKYEEIANLNTQNNQLEQKLNDLQIKQERLKASLASLALANNNQPYNSSTILNQSF